MTIYDILSSRQYPQKSVVKQLIWSITHLTPEQIVTQMDYNLTTTDYEKFQTMYHQYAVEHKPLEYIIGHVTFFGHHFQVNQDTLIPRAETEYMITSVLDYCQTLNSKNVYSLRDIGTGCGVLGCSVLLGIPDRFTHVVMTDISPSALEVAHQNYHTLVGSSHTHTIQMIQTSLLDFVWSDTYQGQSIILVANLPYIPDQTFDTQVSDTVRLREPRMAFVWGGDGLEWYYQMFDQILWYRQTGQIGQIVCFCEMMTRQLDILQKKYNNLIHYDIHATFHFNIIIVEARFL